MMTVAFWIIRRNNSFLMPRHHFVSKNYRILIATLDLDIAKCHFEIGAGKENFSWA